MNHNMYDKVNGLFFSLSLKNEEKRESTLQKVADWDSSKKNILWANINHMKILV